MLLATANCWRLIVASKVALFVGTASSCAPASTAPRGARSKSTSQQVDTPTGIPAARTTPLPCPATKYPASSACSDRSRKNPRQGRYSPNGSMITLSWRSPHPVFGSKTHTVFIHVGYSRVEPGAARIMPTRMGAWIALAAVAIWCAASALVRGSMSDEFSGQITMRGACARPAATSSASRSVSRT